MPMKLLLTAVIAVAATAPAWAAPSVAPPGRAEADEGAQRLSGHQRRRRPARLLRQGRAAALEQAEAAGDVVIVDRAQARAAKRQAFGFNLSALSVFDRALTKEEVDSVTGTATTAYHGSDGRWVIVLDDGARWQQTDDADLYPPPHPGSKIRIRRASLGSYVMNIDGQPFIRVRRDQ